MQLPAWPISLLGRKERTWGFLDLHRDFGALVRDGGQVGPCGVFAGACSLIRHIL